jgi:hypothetical protein
VVVASRCHSVDEASKKKLVQEKKSKKSNRKRLA